MAKKELPEKMFYSITEVAQYYNVNESTLRFWEKEFDLIAPKRSDNKRKIRSYTAQDVQNIGLIYHLLKEQGLTLSGAKEKLKKKPGKTETNYEILSRLRSIRSEIVSICRELDSQMRKEGENLISVPLSAKKPLRKTFDNNPHNILAKPQSQDDTENIGHPVPPVARPIGRAIHLQQLYDTPEYSK